MSEISTKFGPFVCTLGKTYQDVSLQEEAWFNGDADTSVTVPLHVAKGITAIKS